LVAVEQRRDWKTFLHVPKVNGRKKNVSEITRKNWKERNQKNDVKNIKEIISGKVYCDTPMCFPCVCVCVCVASLICFFRCGWSTQKLSLSPNPSPLAL
jgi:hypothetical protein